MIVVYSKPGCGSCIATKRALDKAGVSYETVDVSVDSAAREMLVERGFSAMPVVAPTGDVGSWFGGFQLARLREVIAAEAAA
nr:MAG TPA: glutaredoxin-like protein [Caudoviricetes sp.]